MTIHREAAIDAIFATQRRRRGDKLVQVPLHLPRYGDGVRRELLLPELRGYLRRRFVQ
jgi:hypothetical protein